MLDLLQNTPQSLLWFIAGIVYYILELFLPGFFIFFFGIGAWLMALLLLMPGVDLNFNLQLLIFLIFSIGTILLFRGTIMRVISPTVPDVAPWPPIGEVVETIIPPTYGKIKYMGTYWRAFASVQIPAGASVHVVKRDNLALVVEPIASDSKTLETDSSADPT